MGPWTPCSRADLPNHCCRGDAECCNNLCVEKAYRPWTPCGTTCCNVNYECCNGTCRLRDLGPWTPCTQPGTCCDGIHVCRDGVCERR
jgi:hypothetical protein